MTHPYNYKLAHAMFHQKPAPRGLIADLDYGYGAAGVYYVIVLYRDNFDSLPESTRVAATEWVLETLGRMNAAPTVSAQPLIEESPPEDQ